MLVVLGLTLAGCSHPSAQLSPPKLTSPPSSAPAENAPTTFPTGIRIPSIKVNNNQFMQVRLVGPPSSPELEVPPLSAPMLVAWYRVSAVPGDPGPKPSIVESHINGNEMQGGFAKLDSVKVGDTVQVDRSDQQTAVFKVTATNLYKKADYDKWKAKVFGDVGHPTLKLITCSGDYDKVHRNYLSNRVVSADLVRLQPKSP